ncbi:putative cytosolic translation initiation factor 3 subunit 12 [Podospora australis]|uniref:Eukaryotic translation initiation factor 3 subunit K n=1 Tax=Podospora australis TaxID=1536484 RepID=A0AAN6WMD1_9PEZI|nr:putative cytosolic translation initiation factor 3 subunit 12 [Podospora australis]
MASLLNMNGEDPQERPEQIRNIIGGLERYNPQAAEVLEAYLQQQCEEKFCDCNANRALLKLYQLNPDRIKDEVVTNVLVKTMTQFPSPQFDLAIHLLSPANSNPGPGSTSDLAEAVGKLRVLNSYLESANYSRFWATLEQDNDDIYADLTTDIKGFEDMIRVKIAQLLSQAYREISLSTLEGALGLDGEDKVTQYVTETCGWKIGEGGVVLIPKNAENEAKKTEIREDVSIDMFSRVIKRSWEETA